MARTEVYIKPVRLLQSCTNMSGIACVVSGAYGTFFACVERVWLMQLVAWRHVLQYINSPHGSIWTDGSVNWRRCIRAPGGAPAVGFSSEGPGSGGRCSVPPLWAGHGRLANIVQLYSGIDAVRQIAKTASYTVELIWVCLLHMLESQKACQPYTWQQAHSPDRIYEWMFCLRDRMRMYMAACRLPTSMTASTSMLIHSIHTSRDMSSVSSTMLCILCSKHTQRGCSCEHGLVHLVRQHVVQLSVTHGNWNCSGFILAASGPLWSAVVAYGPTAAMTAALAARTRWRGLSCELKTASAISSLRSSLAVFDVCCCLLPDDARRSELQLTSVQSLTTGTLTLTCLLYMSLNVS